MFLSTKRYSDVRWLETELKPGYQTDEQTQWQRKPQQYFSAEMLPSGNQLSNITPQPRMYASFLGDCDSTKRCLEKVGGNMELGISDFYSARTLLIEGRGWIYKLAQVDSISCVWSLWPAFIIFNTCLCTLWYNYRTVFSMPLSNN